MHRRFYMQTRLHTDPFTHRRLYTQTFFHTEPFTHKHLYTEMLLLTDPFTHKHFYRQTLLHTDTFTNRPFYTQTLLRTHTLFHIVVAVVAACFFTGISKAKKRSFLKPKNRQFGGEASRSKKCRKYRVFLRLASPKPRYLWCFLLLVARTTVFTVFAAGT